MERILPDTQASLAPGHIEKAILTRLRQSVMVSDRAGTLLYANPRAKAHYGFGKGVQLKAIEQEEDVRLQRTLICAATSDQWLPFNLPVTDQEGNSQSVKFLACGLAIPGIPPLVLLLGDPSRDRQFAKLNEMMNAIDRERDRSRRLESQLKLALQRLEEKSADAPFAA